MSWLINGIKSWSTDYTTTFNTSKDTTTTFNTSHDTTTTFNTSHATTTTFSTSHSTTTTFSTSHTTTFTTNANSGNQFAYGGDAYPNYTSWFTYNFGSQIVKWEGANLGSGYGPNPNGYTSGSYTYYRGPYVFGVNDGAYYYINRTGPTSVSRTTTYNTTRATTTTYNTSNTTTTTYNTSNTTTTTYSTSRTTTTTFSTSNTTQRNTNFYA